MTSSLKTLRIVMIGPIASGKGTISSNIMKEYPNFVHISPGDIMRRELQNDTPLGQKAKEFVTKGLLVPDELIVGTIFKVLENASTKNWILDGFPRTIDQAKMLHGILSFNTETKNESETAYESKGLIKNPITGVINLIVPDEIIFERIINRWIHLPSGRVYSAGFREPRVHWKDDVTGEDLVRRADDSPEVVKARIKLHRDVTEPVIDFYRQHHVEVLDLKTNDAWLIVKEFLDKKSEELEKTD